MIYKLLFCWLLLFATVAALQAQEKPKLPDCRKYPVDDSDKRDIADRDSFTLDADGDGKPDTVTTKTYAVKINRRAAMNKIEPPPGETHWIAFDLKMSGGRVLKRFFKFNYGTDQANDSVYALILCSVNQTTSPICCFTRATKRATKRLFWRTSETALKFIRAGRTLIIEKIF